jgi:uncharacterized membrane protein YphA (DoxX/SURF4 family)
MEFFQNLHQMGDAGLLVLRVAIGFIFLMHGIPKLKGTMGKFFVFIGVAETLGGLAMVGGFLTQVAAVGLGIIMIGAAHMKITKMHAKFMDITGGPSWEFDFMIFCALVALFFLGAGAFAVDRMLFAL